MIGAERASVNRQLRKWQRRGIVDLPKGGGVVVQDEAAMAELSQVA
jgi:hypothetical protein